MTDAVPRAKRGTGAYAIRRAHRFRSEVADALSARGFGAVGRAWADARGTAEHDPGDVLGLPGLTITTSTADHRVSLAILLERARARAEGTGTAGVLIQRRQGADVSEAYAVMRLDDFARAARHLGTTTTT